MSLSIGIVGLPNVGKSSLFTALTKKSGFAANYPFATIEPNVGIVPVPDERLEGLASIDHPAKIIPATVEFVDIAGLVAGASQGEGLGNKFLANIRETDAICEVVRFFTDPKLCLVWRRKQSEINLQCLSSKRRKKYLKVSTKGTEHFLLICPTTKKIPLRNCACLP